MVQAKSCNTFDGFTSDYSLLDRRGRGLCIHSRAHAHENTEAGECASSFWTAAAAAAAAADDDDDDDDEVGIVCMYKRNSQLCKYSRICLCVILRVWMYLSVCC